MVVHVNDHYFGKRIELFRWSQNRLTAILVHILSLQLTKNCFICQFMENLKMVAGLQRNAIQFRNVHCMINKSVSGMQCVESVSLDQSS
jgi:hypothetical protein